MTRKSDAGRKLSTVGGILLFLLTSLRAQPPGGPAALIRLERLPVGGGPVRVSVAFAVSPGLLGSITDGVESNDSWRASGAGGVWQVKPVARDAESGFALFAASDESGKVWESADPGENLAAPRPGSILTLQSATPGNASVAGLDILHEGLLLQCPWLRVHLPKGSWVAGTPLTDASGRFAGILAAPVPGVPDAARVLPAAAVRHFVKLWTELKTLARAELGIRLSQRDGIPRVVECYAALPAERSGVQPGDVILRIGTTETPDAAAAVEACFYLRVDEPVKIAVLRGTDTVNLTVTPVSATSRKAAPVKK
jgi:hypothetical protein